MAGSNYKYEVSRRDGPGGGWLVQCYVREYPSGGNAYWRDARVAGPGLAAGEGLWAETEEDAHRKGRQWVEMREASDAARAEKR